MIANHTWPVRCFVAVKWTCVQNASCEHIAHVCPLLTLWIPAFVIVKWIYWFSEKVLFFQYPRHVITDARAIKSPVNSEAMCRGGIFEGVQQQVGRKSCFYHFHNMRYYCQSFFFVHSMHGSWMAIVWFLLSSSKYFLFVVSVISSHFRMTSHFVGLKHIIGISQSSIQQLFGVRSSLKVYRRELMVWTFLSVQPFI